MNGCSAWEIIILLTEKQPSTSSFMTGKELAEQRKKVFKVSTGSKQLDAILGG
jgi:RecA/RadA recombinase